MGREEVVTGISLLDILPHSREWKAEMAGWVIMAVHAGYKRKDKNIFFLDVDVILADPLYRRSEHDRWRQTCVHLDVCDDIHVRIVQRLSEPGSIGSRVLDAAAKPDALPVWEEQYEG